MQIVQENALNKVKTTKSIPILIIFNFLGPLIEGWQDGQETDKNENLSVRLFQHFVEISSRIYLFCIMTTIKESELADNSMSTIKLKIRPVIAHPKMDDWAV